MTHSSTVRKRPRSPTPESNSSSSSSSSPRTKKNRSNSKSKSKSKSKSDKRKCKDFLRKCLVPYSQYVTKKRLFRTTHKFYVKNKKKKLTDSEVPIWFGVSADTANRYSYNKLYKKNAAKGHHFLRSQVSPEDKPDHYDFDDRENDRVRDLIEYTIPSANPKSRKKHHENENKNKTLYLLNLSHPTESFDSRSPNNKPLYGDLLTCIWERMEDYLVERFRVHYKKNNVHLSDDIIRQQVKQQIRYMKESYGGDHNNIRDSDQDTDKDFTIALYGLLKNLFPDKKIIGYCHAANKEFHEEVAIFPEYLKLLKRGKHYEGNTYGNRIK